MGAVAFAEPPAPDDGRRVRVVRKRLGLTQAEFAERLGVTLLTVHRWEAGKSRPQRLARERLRELEEAAVAEAARPEHGAAGDPASSPPLDFAGNPDAVSAVAEAVRLAHGHQFNPAFATEIARIHPLPHQRIAVYERMLRQQPLRFLLADDAGAGKTIMTGLYVREMLLRGRIRRVLIVPPAGLVGNWERELRTLFRLQFRIVTSADARADNPFREPAGDLAIVSLDTLTGDTTFGALRAADVSPYDLVVFDEAHKLSVVRQQHGVRKRRRYQLAEALAGCPGPAGRFAGLGWSARHLLLLTATPHMGRDEPYFYLWRLLDPHAFATGEALRRCPRRERERHFIRRTKEEMVDLDGAPLYRRRACDTFSFDLSPGPGGEQALYDETTAYLRHAYDRALDNRPAARLAMGVFQRRLASSTLAVLRSFERRMEKLERTVADLQSGRVGAADLRRRQRGLDREHGADFFDTHGADDDARDDGAGERHEDYEDAVLGALVAVTIEELKREIDTLAGLKARARRLFESGRESKFERLREVLEDPHYAGEKWLVFTEHRDTADYLVRRLEGLGFSGHVGQIHGGLDWTAREAQVEGFRRPDGARFLVATDAAGEGINLQFCRLMVNYDIPWNPARLEQRMGRIHRYGQRHDVRMVNFIAGSTHEGRVLRVLLEKLDTIRKQLRSDKVFDVIGRLFENTSLREYMVEALTDAGERKVVDRVTQTLAGDPLAAVREADERVYGPPGEVAERLGTLRSDMERERYLQLLPGYVRRFVEKSAALLDLEIRGDLDAVFALAPRRPGALDHLLPALEGYPPAAREHLCVRRPTGHAEEDAPSIWLHPGEPVFDALAARIQRTFARDALRGSIFTDPRADEPHFFHLALASAVQEGGPQEMDGEPREAGGGALREGDDRPQGAGGGPPGRDAATTGVAEPGGRQLLEQRLVGIRQGADGAPVQRPVEHLLLLHGAPGVAPGAVPLASQGVGLRAAAAAYADREVAAPMAEAHRAELQAALPERRRRVGIGFDLRAADLAGRRAKLSNAARAGAVEELDAVKREQRLLSEERRQVVRRIEIAPERIVPGDVRFLAHALVVPAPASEERERYDARVEEIAVRIAAGWERDRGADLRDVSRPELARLAGLPDWPGFDLLATRPGGNVRSIEVKGRAGRAPVQLEANEWKQALHLGDRYWLYVVLDCATPDPTLVRVQNPFAKLLARSRESSAYVISTASLLEAAERA